MTESKTSSGPRNVAFGLITAVVMGLLGLQTFAAVTGRQRTYPFQSYPMYSTYHREGEHLSDAPQVVVTLDDGQELLLSSAEVFPDIRDKDLRFFIFNRNFVGPVLRGDRGIASRRVASYEKSTGHRVRAVRVQTLPLVITHDGARPSSPETMAVMELTAP